MPRQNPLTIQRQNGQRKATRISDLLCQHGEAKSGGHVHLGRQWHHSKLWPCLEQGARVRAVDEKDIDLSCVHEEVDDKDPSLCDRGEPFFAYANRTCLWPN